MKPKEKLIPDAYEAMKSLVDFSENVGLEVSTGLQKDLRKLQQIMDRVRIIVTRINGGDKWNK